MFTAFIDGQFVGRYEKEGFENGSFGLAYWSSVPTSARYDNFIVYPLSEADEQQ